MPKPIGLLHPGEMGAVVGGALVAGGHEIAWASEGRGPESARRAEANGLTDYGTVTAVREACDVILSICPPHAAMGVAETVAGFDGTFVEANAIAPQTSREIAELVERAGTRYVDGSIIGPPPVKEGINRLYLAGAGAEDVAELFAASLTDARVISADIPDASALKMTYAAWTKGTWALVLAIRSLARAEGVDEHLLAEWELSMPHLPGYSAAAARQVAEKGWRWVGEMEEIAATFGGADLPDGFHLAAADVYRRVPRPEGQIEDSPELLDEVLAYLSGARTG